MEFKAVNWLSLVLKPEAYPYNYVVFQTLSMNGGLRSLVMYY